MGEGNEESGNEHVGVDFGDVAVNGKKYSRKRRRPVRVCEAAGENLTSNGNRHEGIFRISGHRPLHKYVKRLEGGKWICTFGCRSKPFAGAYIRIRAHLVGLLPSEGKEHAIPLCPNVSTSMRERLRKEEYEAHIVLLEKLRETYAPSLPKAFPSGTPVVPSSSNCNSIPDANISETDDQSTSEEEVCDEIDAQRSPLVQSPSDDDSAPTENTSQSNNGHEESEHVCSPDASKQFIDSEGRAQALESLALGVGIRSSSGGVSAINIDISSLNSPQNRDPEHVNPDIRNARLNILPHVKDLLVVELTHTQDVNEMIDAANASFAYLDFLCTDYTPLYTDVKSFISFHLDRVKAEAMKNHSAFRLKDQYEKLVSAEKDAIEVDMETRRERSFANGKVVEYRAKVEETKYMLRKLTEKREEWAQKCVASDAKHSQAAEKLSVVQEEKKRISFKLVKSAAIVEEVERRLEKANVGIREMTDLLLSDL